MSTALSRWGNSLAVRIPADLAKKAHIQEGDALALHVSRRGRITLEAVSKEPDFGALYDAITPDNRYEEVNSGSEVGKEALVW